MKSNIRLPWPQMWDFLSSVSSGTDVQSMFMAALKELARLIPYEQAFACFAEHDHWGGTPSVSVIGVNLAPAISKAYLEHYYAIDTARHEIQLRKPLFHQVCWRDPRFTHDEFASDFVRRMLRVDFSAGIPLFDGMGSMMMGFTRTCSTRLSSRDERILLHLHPHLASHYRLRRRLRPPVVSRVLPPEVAAHRKLLSRREAQIADLIVKRQRPSDIAEMLSISTRTVESHIEHLYQKLEVKNRQDFIARIEGWDAGEVHH